MIPTSPEPDGTVNPSVLPSAIDAHSAAVRFQSSVAAVSAAASSAS
jgi:hypothetical protein